MQISYLATEHTLVDFVEVGARKLRITEQGR